jgi:hypothetical protein
MGETEKKFRIMQLLREADHAHTQLKGLLRIQGLALQLSAESVGQLTKPEEADALSDLLKETQVDVREAIDKAVATWREKLVALEAEGYEPGAAIGGDEIR